MKKKFINAVDLLLVLIFVATGLFGCRKNSSNEEKTSYGSSNATTTQGKYISDDLPSDLNYDGKTVTIVTWEETREDDFPAELTQNIISYETYYSRMRVEKRLNVDLSIISYNGSWDFRDKYIKQLEAALTSGSLEVDIVGSYTPAAAIGAIRGLFGNLNDNEYLNFDKPWWPGNIVESVSIGNNLYFCSGDITPTCINAIGSVFINLDMYTDLKIEGNLYEIVNNYEWTMEK